MKKLFVSLSVLVITITPMFYVPEVKAETLGDLEKELNKRQSELKDTNAKKAQTQAEINSVNKNISNIKNEISQTYKDIASLDEEIEKLNTNISNAEKEIKEIISYLQVSNGESATLEYVSGASDWESFIYRMAVTEQLSDHNDAKISEFNKMINDNKEKQKQIQSKRVSLGEKQQQLTGELSKLGKEMEDIKAVSVSQADDVKAQQKIVDNYKKMGCKSNDDITECSRGLLPAGTAFYRPLVSGRVTSEWGTRYYMGKSFHEGIDMGVSEGNTVYAIGTGQVALIMHRYSCGGNMVVVHHKINGKTYTSVYAHLLSINVSEGQNVTSNTVIGSSGGGSTASYDRCTGGAHLHLTVATGLYGIDYKGAGAWNLMNYTYSINPRSVINFPALGVPFNNRMAKY